MSATTSIQWCDKTWNPSTGCDHVSPGCDHCYAEVMAKRCQAMGEKTGFQDYRNGFKFTIQPHRLDDPKRWRKPQRIFVNSMSDLFHREMPLDFLGQVLKTIIACPQHTFQVLTKRPERMARMLGPHGCGFYASETPVPCPQPNLWLGVSVESERYIPRIHTLANVPSAVRFISFEPLLEDLAGLLPSDLKGIHWAILGAESGPGARPCDPDWLRRIKRVCEAAGVAVFVKQLGSVWAKRKLGPPFHGLANSTDSKGGRMEDWPSDLRHREFPPRYWIQTGANPEREYSREQYLDFCGRMDWKAIANQSNVPPFSGYLKGNPIIYPGPYSGRIERVFK